jgi:hypothetical protein
MLIGGWLLAGSSALAVDDPRKITFPLYPNPAFVSCMAADGKTPEVQVTVRRGLLHDHMRVVLKHFKNGLSFDLFTVQRSNQLAAGGPDLAFTDFGLAWYQSEIRTTRSASRTEIDTILLDKIFGFDPAVGLTPTQTLHVGFWFDKPADAAACGFNGPPTPFSETHDAGPVAFISRPDALTGLGPLCTSPNTSTTPATCNP